MSTVPSIDQINDLRADIGDQDGSTFSDDEIVRIWERVSGASDENRQHEAALAMMARQLMANAAKLTNYRAGAVSESRDQIFKHLEKLYALYKPSLDAALGTGRQFAKSTIRSKPRQNRTEPDEPGRYRRPPPWGES